MPEVSNVGIVANDNAPINARETQEAVNGEEQGARRRGRRGGRGRSERRNDAEASTSEVLAQENSAPLMDSDTQVTNQEPVIVVIPAPESVTPAVAVVAPIIEVPPLVAEPLPVAAEVVPADIEPALEMPAAVDVVKSIEIIAPTVAIAPKPVDLEKTLADSGLMMVQTTAAAVVAQPEAPIKLGRPRKQKPLNDQADSEPLVSVETHK